ncbi:hypothetical protein Dhaf_0630 [Desulfitobacterium hafniense DCB-2]|uniref:Uncharacterized protein n=2 Tax=Desulfitobacterium hafniense TaxID=49338 RepID=A0A098AX15_DESHA|nr:hypothetical protein [Desulfitobacterium hafniense]ACL18696.1 hypothetical protein Dhaf_0630 [Desulfitobacterium hafniense DCB-2]CDX00662.1 Hypothetical protein DPCES_0775 [Desulfitobacterium hafniense]
MMNGLLTTMSNDMNIPRYLNESDKSFIYRLCYSALGQWCLSTAMNSTGGAVGTTKHNQTIVLNDLLSRYTELFPQISEKFIDTSSQQTNFSVSVRRTYEETGYLLTDSDNHNRIASYGRTIRVGDKFLFFGLPGKPCEVNGLGLFANSTDYLVALKDFLIRDSLTSEAYFDSRFDPIDFYQRDIDLSELEFFNPKSNNVPSMSWTKKPETDCTVARKTETGPFYRIMKVTGEIQFADEPIELQTDSFTSYEYRRLYFALKTHYGNPLRATITKLDELYSKIRIGGHLPNREYYLLLLLSWPEHSAFDKVNFIIRNELIAGVTDTLVDIGIEIKGGQPNA